MNKLEIFQCVIAQIVEVPEKIAFILKGGVANFFLTPHGRELIKEFFFEYEFIGGLESLVSNPQVLFR